MCVELEKGLGLGLSEQPPGTLDGEYETLPTANKHTQDRQSVAVKQAV